MCSKVIDDLGFDCDSDAFISLYKQRSLAFVLCETLSIAFVIVMFNLILIVIQVPQYILDYMWGKGEPCKVVCTQPRRISAISGWPLMHNSQTYLYIGMH